MKNLFSLLAIAGIMYFSAPTSVYAQEDDQQEFMLEEVATDSLSEEADSIIVDSNTVAVQEVVEKEPAVDEALADPKEPTREVLSFHQTVKRYFIEGGAAFMASVLICLILGLALSIEPVSYTHLRAHET